MLDHIARSLLEQVDLIHVHEVPFEGSNEADGVLPTSTDGVLPASVDKDLQLSMGSAFRWPSTCYCTYISCPTPVGKHLR